MRIIEIGSNVLIADKKIQAQVTAACIRGNDRVTYECVWWDGNTRKCEWLDSIEIERRSTTNTRTLGFSLDKSQRQSKD